MNPTNVRRNQLESFRSRHNMATAWLFKHAVEYT